MYRYLTKEETEQTIARVQNTLDTLPLSISGPQRQLDWEKGWAENFWDFVSTGNLNTLVPKFVKNEIMRFPDQYIMPLRPDLETCLVDQLRKELFSDYFNDVDFVYEFGSGTGHNLVALARMFPDKQLYGLDWSKVACELIDVVARRYKFNMSGCLFDMFKPNYYLDIVSRSGLFTIGAMEQLGVNFEPFLKFALEKRFDICINIETLYELYDQSMLYDSLAARYLEKRGYLRGYLPRLKELEAKGKIEILKIHKGFGCLYHNGYSYVIWRPLVREILASEVWNTDSVPCGVAV